jgi:hypothetical protein
MAILATLFGMLALVVVDVVLALVDRRRTQ